MNPPCFCRAKCDCSCRSRGFTPCFASPITFCISLLYENIICRSPLFFLSYYPQKWYNPIMNILEYENYQEKIPHGNPLFPYITYPCSIPLDFSRVPLHWHDEMEIIYIKKGTGAITVDFKSYVVTEGTIALILPGRLHSIEQYMRKAWNTKISFSIRASSFPKKRTPAIPNFLRRCCRASCPFRSYISRDLPAMRRLPPALTPTMKSAGRPARLSVLYQESALYAFLHFIQQMPLKRAGKARPQIAGEDELILKYLENHYMEQHTIADISAEVG